MTLDYCCRLPKWQAVKRRSLRYSTCRMGNSRKYPYYTMDGFYILTPHLPLPMDFLNASSPHALKIPWSLAFFPFGYLPFQKRFQGITRVCPWWKFHIYPPHHALGVPIVFPALPSEFPWAIHGIVWIFSRITQWATKTCNLFCNIATKRVE